MALPGLTNQGSPGLAASIVDAQEYIWDTSSGGEWIPRIGTSGAATVVTLQSGEMVRVVNLSGEDLSLTIASGSWVATTISAQPVALVSGTRVEVTGIYISGVQVFVEVSGDIVRATNLSGQDISISGQYVGLVSGTEVQIFDIANTFGWSGELNSGEIPPLVRVASMSGVEPIVVAISGQVVNISGQPVTTTLSFPSGITTVRDTYDSGDTVSSICSPLYDFWLESVAVHISGTVPTTSRELVVEATDSNSVYSVKILSENPATNSWTDLLFQPPNPLLLTSGDSIIVSYDNADNKIIGVKIVTREFIGTG